MKKTIWLVLATAGLMTMTSCNNKPAKQPEETPQEAPTNTEENPETAKVVKKVDRVAGNSLCSLSIPDKWEINEETTSDRMVELRIPKPDSEEGDLGFIRIMADKDESRTAEDVAADKAKNGDTPGGELQADVTIGETTYKVVKHKDNADANYTLFAEMPEKGVYEVTVNHINLDDAGLKTILSSLVFK